MNQDLFNSEYELYKASLKKDTYLYDSFDFQYSIEERLYNLCARYDALDVYQFISEQIRDYMYVPIFKNNVDPLYLPVCRFAAYKYAKTIIEHLEKDPDLQARFNIIREGYNKNVKEKSEKKDEDQTILFVRGVSKYWRTKIDENAEDTEEIPNDQLQAWCVL